MERGLYIAASGMVAELARQDQLANDLANASTPGYKPERAARHSFGEILLANRENGRTIGRSELGVAITGTTLDTSEGALRETGEPLDVAIVGDGYLAVQTDGGVRYTRNGRLAVDGEGRLVTATGQPVLGEDGGPIQAAGGKVEIAGDGTVKVGGRETGRLAIVALADPAKEGDSLLSGTPGPRPEGTTVRQGSLEGSGVEAVQAMVEMLASLRAFESSQRVIRTIDDTLGRGINGVGGSS